MILIKTKLEIGRFIQASTDGDDIRQIDAVDLIPLQLGTFELIHSMTDSDEFRLAQTMILNKLMKNVNKMLIPPQIINN